MKTVKKLFLLTSIAASLVAPVNAADNPATAEFHVTIRIKPVCEVNTYTGNKPTEEATTPSAGADIDFGEYFSNHTANVDGESKGGATQSIGVKCTTGTPYQIALTPETDNNNAGGGNMKGLGGTGAEGNKIAYALYQDSARSTSWGDSLNTNTLKSTGAGFAQEVHHPVYGRVSGSELNKPAGRYTDKVTVAVHY